MTAAGAFAAGSVVRFDWPFVAAAAAAELVTTATALLVAASSTTTVALATSAMTVTVVDEFVPRWPTCNAVVFSTATGAAAVAEDTSDVVLFVNELTKELIVAAGFAAGVFEKVAVILITGLETTVVGCVTATELELVSRAAAAAAVTAITAVMLAAAGGAEFSCPETPVCCTGAAVVVAGDTGAAAADSLSTVEVVFGALALDAVVVLMLPRFCPAVMVING